MTTVQSIFNELQLMGALVLLVVTVSQVQLLRNPESRPFWFAQLTLLIGQSLQVYWPYHYLDTTIGVPGSAAVVKHLFALCSAANASAVVLTLMPSGAMPVRGVRKYPWPLFGVAALAATLPWLVDPPTTLSPLLQNRAEYFDNTARSLIHWTAFLTYLGWTLYGPVRLTRTFRKTRPPRHTRVAVGLVGLGMAIGGLYVLEKAIVVIAWLIGRSTPGLVLFDQIAEALVLSVSVTLIALGAGWESLTAHVERVQLHRRRRAQVRDLAPFAQLIGTCYPELQPPTDLQTDQQLVANVALIHEGLRRLTAYSTFQTAANIVTTQADWLRQVVNMRMRREPPTATLSAPPVTDLGESDSTVAYLVRLYEEAQLTLDSELIARAGAAE